MKVYNVQLVKIRPEKRLAHTSELSSAPRCAQLSLQTLAGASPKSLSRVNAILDDET